MSDPVSKVQIEDVLSSIERLVSHENPAQPATAETFPRNVTDHHEALVLTPDYRVDDIESSAERDAAENAVGSISPAGENDSPQDHPFDRTHLKTPLHRHDDRGPDTSAPYSARGIFGGSTALMGNEPPRLFSDPDPGLGADGAGEIVDPDATFAMPRYDTPDPETGCAPLAEDRTAVAQPQQPDSATDSAPGFMPDRPVVTERSALDRDFRAACLRAKVDALEAAVARARRDLAGNGSCPADARLLPDEPAPQQDNSEPESAEIRNSAPICTVSPGADVSLRTEPAPDCVAAPDDLLRSEKLRELVAEIVRDELKGDLGVRMTSNLRKLVRREIHRALTVQDLE
jgi:hypothetical protein